MFIISFFLFVISIGLSVWSINICKKAKRLADEAQARYEDAKEVISNLQGTLSAAARQIPNDYPVSFHLGLNDGRGNVFVYAKCPTSARTETMVCIKSFHDEDLDFAIREAEELLDHLNEK